MNYSERSVDYQDRSEIWQVVADKRRRRGDEAGAERAEGCSRDNLSMFRR